MAARTVRPPPAAAKSAAWRGARFAPGSPAGERPEALYQTLNAGHTEAGEAPQRRRATETRIRRRRGEPAGGRRHRARATDRGSRERWTFLPTARLRHGPASRTALHRRSPRSDHRAVQGRDPPRPARGDRDETGRAFRSTLRSLARPARPDEFERLPEERKILLVVGRIGTVDLYPFPRAGHAGGPKGNDVAPRELELRRCCDGKANSDSVAADAGKHLAGNEIGVEAVDRLRFDAGQLEEQSVDLSLAAGRGRIGSQAFGPGSRRWSERTGARRFGRGHPACVGAARRRQTGWRLSYPRSTVPANDSNASRPSPIAPPVSSSA